MILYKYSTIHGSMFLLITSQDERQYYGVAYSMDSKFFTFRWLKEQVDGLADTNKELFTPVKLFTSLFEDGVSDSPL